MEINGQKENDVLIVEISGRLDANTSSELQERLVRFIDGGDSVMAIDCSRLDYISSAGLRVFLTALKKANTVNGKLAIFACRDNIKQIFDISGFKSILKLYDTKSEAVSGLSQ